MHSHADRQQVEDIKRALSDPRSLVEALGLAEGSKPQSGGAVSIRCPSHGEKNPSCSIRRGEDGTIGVRCFACDFSGDALTLIAVVRGLDPHRDFGEVLAEAAELAGIDIGRKPDRSRPRLAVVKAAPAAKETTDLGPLWASLPPLGGDGWEYLKSRNLEEAAIHCRAIADDSAPCPPAPEGHERDDKGERHCGGAEKCAACRWEYARSGYAIAVALRDAMGRVVAIQVRSIRAEKTHDKDRRFLAIGPTSAGMFGAPESVADRQRVLVCEGLTDTLAALIDFADAQNTAVVGFPGTKATAVLAGLPWKDKRVLVATDPDAATKPGEVKGEEAAQIITAMIQKAGGHPMRLRPEGGKDLAAMHAAGGNLLAFAKAAKEREAGFSGHERMIGNRARRLAVKPRLLRLGVSFVDAAFGGVRPTDRILVGAKQGAGKTEIATIFATNVARRCSDEPPKRVHFFALEADEGEIEERIKWRMISSMAWPDLASWQQQRLSFTAWGNGEIDDLTGPYEDACDRLYQERYSTLRTFYRKGKNGFTHADMTRIASDLRGETDLIILDHLHYIDIADDNENRGMKRLLQAIDAACDEAGAPLVLLAHLKKLERKGAPLVPQLDDFRGTSDIGGIVKRAITIAPAIDQARPESHLLPTYFRLAKNRPDGSRGRFVGLVHFDVRTNTYASGYTIGQLVKNETKFEACTAKEIPPWAIGTANPPPLLSDAVMKGAGHYGDDDDRP